MQADPDPDRPRADDEALDWLLMLGELPDDPALRSRFEKWRIAHPANAAAWRETARVYDAIGTVAPAHPDVPTHRATPHRRRRTAAGAGPSWRRVGRVVVPAAAAAALTVAILPDAVLRWRADVVTGTGEVRTIALADGSSASLGPRTAITIRYSGGERRIRLLRGQAWFDVRHDAARPFRVTAAAIETTDIGTAFEIRQDERHVHVGVAEGIVRVARTGSARPIAARLAAGQALSIPAAGMVGRRAVSPELVGAWRDGQLAVRDQPMRDVIDAMRPWYGGIIIVRSPALAERPVTGFYHLRDPAGAMRALTKAYGGRITHVTPWLMILSER